MVCEFSYVYVLMYHMSHARASMHVHATCTGTMHVAVCGAVLVVYAVRNYKYQCAINLVYDASIAVESARLYITGCLFGT